MLDLTTTGPIAIPRRESIAPTALPSDPSTSGESDRMTRAEKMRILGEMASGVVHDVNNMLGAILGRAQLASMKTDLEEVRKHLAQIEKIALQGGETVKRLQEFTRHCPRGAMQPTDLNQVVADALDVTRHRWEAQAHGHGTIYLVDTRPGANVRIPGIHSELVDAVANMIFNALDAMPDGGRLILETCRDGDLCRLIVADEGMGMTAEQAARVFSPFYTTKGAHGTGLGLAVVSDIVGRHSGQIRVESAPQQGSRFIIEFAAAGGAIDIPAGDSVFASLASTNVLLVDDDPTILDVIGEALRDAGHRLTSCDNGAAALVAMEKCHFDVIVTDLGMPGVTGWDIARRARDLSPRPPVIVISGWGAQIDKNQLADCGVDALLAKPFHLDQIRETIARLARLPQQSPA
ncbi:MAG: response regulator [candidate division Zixibacteria bacterium]|nr:response regulator [candidate division Zixibacteria bacterium]